MAVTTATYTATLRVDPMQANVNGVCFARAKTTIVTTSTSHIERVYLCKIPHGAVIVDGYVSWSNGADVGTNANPGTLNLGLSEAGSDKTLTFSMVAASSVSALATVRLPSVSGSLPKLVSLSSDATNQYKWVVMTANRPTTHTSNATLYADVVIMYTMDRQVENMKTIV